MKKDRNATVLATNLPALAAFKDVPCQFRAASKTGRGTLDLYGIIGADWFGDGITTKMVSDALAAMGSVTSVDVNINSPGGDVFEGRGIYNLLKKHPARVNVYVAAEASSAASLIAMAGDEITMAEGSVMMIHRASGVAVGNVDAVKRLLNRLEQVDDMLVSTYASRSGNSIEKVRAWMEAETWMTANEAVLRGFAEKSDEPAKVAALAVDRRLLGFKNIPNALRPNRTRAMRIISGTAGT
jgi:ATP-dependent Clp protease protease subunit